MVNETIGGGKQTQSAPSDSDQLLYFCRSGEMKQTRCRCKYYPRLLLFLFPVIIIVIIALYTSFSLLSVEKDYYDAEPWEKLLHNATMAEEGEEAKNEEAIAAYENETVALDAEYSSSTAEKKEEFPVSAVETTKANEEIRAMGAARFVPYPHNTLGSGKDMQCTWETRSTNNNNSFSSEFKYDFTQLSALSEGVCIPPQLNASLHIFSSVEAIDCLSPKTVIISGDSYMKQLFIGLADILLSKHLFRDDQILGKVRRHTLVKETQKILNNRRKKNASFPRIIYTCEDECYGIKPLSFCSRCVNKFTNKDENTVCVVGAGIHIISRHNLSYTVNEMRNFFKESNRTIFVSLPSKVRPEQHYNKSDTIDRVYVGMLPNVAPRNPRQPFLDVFQLTRSCWMENCSYDGNHRSRYVNRWKAQLLLNTLCEI